MLSEKKVLQHTNSLIPPKKSISGDTGLQIYYISFFMAVF